MLGRGGAEPAARVGRLDLDVTALGPQAGDDEVELDRGELRRRRLGFSACDPDFDSSRRIRARFSPAPGCPSLPSPVRTPASNPGPGRTILVRSAGPRRFRSRRERPSMTWLAWQFGSFQSTSATHPGYGSRPSGRSASRGAEIDQGSTSPTSEGPAAPPRRLLVDCAQSPGRDEITTFPRALSDVARKLPGMPDRRKSNPPAFMSRHVTDSGDGRPRRPGRPTGR